MMRSLFSGVSGLNNHQTRMDVIGNNVSNVNTHGFKKGRVTFQDLLSQRVTGAARPSAERGGVNPKQVGLGVQIAAIDTIHTQGALQATGINTDLAISGNGFFIQRDGDKTMFTRAGAFGLDANGTLVNPANGYRVQGFQAVDNGSGEKVIDIASEISDIRIPIGAKSPARATSLVRYKSNLNKLTPLIQPGDSQQNINAGTWTTTIQIQDSRGENMSLKMSFVKSTNEAGNEVPNEWLATARVYDKSGNEIPGVQAKVNEADISNNFLVQFNTAGALRGIADPNNPQNAIGIDGQALNVNLQFNVPGSDATDIDLGLGTSGRYDGLTQFASASSTKAFFQDGVTMGYMESFSIDSSGVVIGSYSNGLKEQLGQVSIANFSNPGGLEKNGETNYVETFNSGQASYTIAGNQGAGNIQAGVLEMSNVDLANEFSDMIVTQRGFQANSRSITTSDSMLEEVLRLKR